MLGTVSTGLRENGMDFAESGRLTRKEKHGHKGNGARSISNLPHFELKKKRTVLKHGDPAGQSSTALKVLLDVNLYQSAVVAPS